MALFWIVHDVEGARGVRIEKSHALSSRGSTR